MNILKIIMMLVDPLLVAFILSVAIGVFFKRSSGKLLAKYILCGLSFLGYLALYVSAVFIWKNLFSNIVVMAPVALIAIVLIVSIIVAPKGEVVKVKSDERLFTGYDSLFPNDIDNR